MSLRTLKVGIQGVSDDFGGGARRQSYCAEGGALRFAEGERTSPLGVVESSSFALAWSGGQCGAGSNAQGLDAEEGAEELGEVPVVAQKPVNELATGANELAGDQDEGVQEPP